MELEFAIFNCICEFMLEVSDNDDAEATFLNKWSYTYQEMIDNSKLFTELLKNIKKKRFSKKDCFDILITDLIIVRNIDRIDAISFAKQCLYDYSMHITESQIDSIIQSHAGKNVELAKIIGNTLRSNY